VVLRLLKDEPLDALSRELGVELDRLEGLRHVAQSSSATQPQRGLPTSP
jgi:hypothetical protein